MPRAIHLYQSLSEMNAEENKTSYLFFVLVDAESAMKGPVQPNRNSCGIPKEKGWYNQ